MEKRIHIAIAPSPWLSILVSAFEFSKRLASLRPDFQVTFLIPIFESPSNAIMARLENLPPNLNPILLPPVTKHDMPPGIPKHEVFLPMKFTLLKSLPHIHENLKSLSSKASLAAIVVDQFSIDVLDFAKQLNTQSYVYMSTCATTLCVFFQLPKLDETTSCDFRDLSEPIQIPGCVQLHGRDLPSPVLNRSSPAYNYFIQMTKKLSSADLDGFLVCSFAGVEEGPAKAFMENYNIPVYLVGPVLEKDCSYPKDEEEASECLKWLEKQPPKSVLYICFGGGAKLSQYNTNELAMGLELSGKKFLWVMRPPFDAPNVDDANKDPLQFLPQGFLERTKEQGLVVPLWVPQIPILRHSSIGGFLSHSGWNSVMESVQQGVPVIAWPITADQRIKANLLTKGLKMAFWLKVNENGKADKEEISKVIKSLMEDEEGKEIYKRTQHFRDAAADAVKDDGSSTKAILEMAAKCENFNRM